MKNSLRLAIAALALSAMTVGAVAQDRSQLMQQHRGGELKLLAAGFDGSIDPQIAYDELIWQIHAVVYDKLLTYKKADGTASDEIVPDLAEAMPTIEDGGKTYVFKLRKGIKFSNGHELVPADVVSSFERIFTANSPTSGSMYAGIVGATECLREPAACSLAKGVVANDADNTITIHLKEPDAEFLNKVAMFHASIIPADTQRTDMGTAPVPGTGPYMIASYDPASGLKATRNPYFKEWSVDAQPDGYVDEISYSFGLDRNSALNAVLNDQADWMYGEPPTERLGEISASYSNRAHVYSELSYYLAPMNTRVPPFDNEKVRQALALAVDRAALVDGFGGPNLAEPTCQNLPKGVPGHVDSCIYTLDPGTEWSAPDLDTAKKLIEESGTKGMKVTVFGDDRPHVKANALYLQSLLSDLGYDAEVKILSESLYWNYINDTENKVQIAVHRWMADYPHPGNFIGMLFTCRTYLEHSTSNLNVAGFCDPKAEEMIKEANTLALTDTAAAMKKWTEIDRYITEKAPAIPLYQPKIVNVFSSRVGGDPIMFPTLTAVTVSSLWVQ